jgi:hypothetical protein
VPTFKQTRECSGLPPASAKISPLNYSYFSSEFRSSSRYSSGVYRFWVMRSSVVSFAGLILHETRARRSTSIRSGDQRNLQARQGAELVGYHTQMPRLPAHSAARRAKVLGCEFCCRDSFWKPWMPSSKTEVIDSRMTRRRQIFTGNPLFDPPASAASASSAHRFNLDLAKCPDFRL